MYARSFAGRAFPCDVCHEEQCDACEAGTWASRMLCGYCSHEMGYSSKDPTCTACGARLSGKAGGRAQNHWCGGQGPFTFAHYILLFFRSNYSNPSNGLLPKPGAVHTQDSATPAS